MRVAWIDGVPVVNEIQMMGDGHPSIVVYSKEESLKLMWAEIERLQTQLDASEDFILPLGQEPEVTE